MPQMQIVRADDGSFFVVSFPIGMRRVVCNSPKPKTEDEFLAHLMWLVRHNHEDDAEILLDEYCRRKRKSP